MERSARPPSPLFDAGVWPYDTLPCAYAHFFPNALPPKAMFVPALSEAMPVPAPLEAMHAPAHLIAATPPKMNKMLPHSGDRTTAAPNPNSGGLRKKAFRGLRRARRWGRWRAV